MNMKKLFGGPYRASAVLVAIGAVWAAAASAVVLASHAGMIGFIYPLFGIAAILLGLFLAAYRYEHEGDPEPPRDEQNDELVPPHGSIGSR